MELDRDPWAAAFRALPDRFIAAADLRGAGRDGAEAQNDFGFDGPPILGFSSGVWHLANQNLAKKTPNLESQQVQIWKIFK